MFFGSQAQIYILFLIKVSFLPLIHPRLPLITQQSLVGEALAGLFPATGGAPLVLALHSVHLAALFGLAATLSADTQIMWMRNDKKGQRKGQGSETRCMGAISIRTAGRGNTTNQQSA